MLSPFAMTDLFARPGSRPGDGIDRSSATPLQAVRAHLERCWRDFGDDRNDIGAPDRLARTGALRDA